MDTTDEIIPWLMEGDPAIRWQTLKDLQTASAEHWQAERGRTLVEGWGRKYLELQAADGSWGGGIYSPKWISTTYTLLSLIGIGIPGNYPAAQKGARLTLDRMLGPRFDEAFMHNLAGLDRCIVGMDLAIASYFEVRDERVEAMVENLLSERMPDGGWNCRRLRQPRPHHSSFHTTFNVLEGLRLWLETTPEQARRSEILEAEKAALGFMLEHRLFKSDKTGEVIHHNFTLLSYPQRWHYNVLRGLEYFARADWPYDERLEEAIELLQHRRGADGRWPVQHKYAGKSFFDMEKVGGPSRWNTLRALRVLRWWERISR
jgi:hypothetical protein